jgi:hypothetical protein
MIGGYNITFMSPYGFSNKGGKTKGGDTYAEQDFYIHADFFWRSSEGLTQQERDTQARYFTISDPRFDKSEATEYVKLQKQGEFNEHSSETSNSVSNSSFQPEQ